MQPEQPNRVTPVTQPQAGQAQVAPRPWVKPTFDQVPLNDALSNFVSPGSTDAGNSYSS